MSKAFDKIAAGLEDAIAFVEGTADERAFRVHVPSDVDVVGIRKKLNLTQGEFAAQFGFSSAAVKDWEQRRRKPEASARVLLTVIEKEPDAVIRALAPEPPHVVEERDYEGAQRVNVSRILPYEDIERNIPA